MLDSATERDPLERQIINVTHATPSRIPILIGGCGSGKTNLLHQVSNSLDSTANQYIDVERSASTPESFWSAIQERSPYSLRQTKTSNSSSSTARIAFDNLLQFLCDCRLPNGDPATFLVDEFFELKMFESFPGIRHALPELLNAVTESENRFVFSTRYSKRATKLLEKYTDHISIIEVPPLTVTETSQHLLQLGVGRTDSERDELSKILLVLADGRPSYVRTLSEALSAMEGAEGGDPVSTLASQLVTGAPLSQLCRISYERRLGRARGYGALKAILQVLSEEDMLNLTEIAHRLGRTPGSTKDYLSWLEDVDLIEIKQKRYRFQDPLLCLWVNLHSRPEPPSEFELSREAQEYAVSRLPFMEATEKEIPETLPQNSAAPREWSIIEID
tara:strand:+ start:1508 stop:2677 length:1170 start_codon:yes stop_codon:yes gene_type:complete